MASVFELANLSWMAYSWEKNTFFKWKRRRTYGPTNGKGFYAELYHNSVKNEAVMAIRGTDIDQKDTSDFMSDLQLAIGYVPSQYKSAKSAYDFFKGFLAANRLGNTPIVLTGHSLGGGLASLLMAKEHFPKPAYVVTFNSPGMEGPYIASHSPIPLLNQTIGRYNYMYYFDKTPFLHIRACGDIISRIGKHIGAMEDVYVDEWGDDKILGRSRHEAQHSIENMVNSLNRMPAYHKNIALPEFA